MRRSLDSAGSPADPTGLLGINKWHVLHDEARTLYLPSATTSGADHGLFSLGHLVIGHRRPGDGKRNDS